MDKIDIGAQGFLYPMPMTLIGADLESGPSFMATAWVNRCQFQPPRVVAGLGTAHATNAGIRKYGEFSVCIPEVDQVQSPTGAV
jgi:flavin reductase (DIM6/NTAB) family NADH-FMN oxidoreductase RutF